MRRDAIPCNISAEDLLTAMSELPPAAAASWPSLSVTFSSNVSANGIISIAFELNSFIVGSVHRWYWAPVGATCAPGPARDRPSLKFVSARSFVSVTQQNTRSRELGKD